MCRRTEYQLPGHAHAPDLPRTAGHQSSCCLVWCLVHTAQPTAQCPFPDSPGSISASGVPPRAKPSASRCHVNADQQVHVSILVCLGLVPATTCLTLPPKFPGWTRPGCYAASCLPAIFRPSSAFTTRIPPGSFFCIATMATHMREKRVAKERQKVYHPLAPVCRIHEADFLPHRRSKGPVYRPASNSWMATA